VRSDEKVVQATGAPPPPRDLLYGGMRSWSGHERDHLFISQGGAAFHDVSGVSGLDNESDGRGFVVWDYDRDGRQDVALVSSNDPLLSLYRNRSADGAGTGPPGHFLAFRFVGSNHSSRAAARRTARDGYGAKIRLDLGDLAVLREHRCGEGLGTQNSATLVIGIGAREGARGVRVDWPSGRHAERGPVPASTLVTVYEDSAQAPGGEAFVLEPYRRVALAASQPPEGAEESLVLSAGAPPARVSVYTTMATWCASCRRELPRIDRLRAVFLLEELGLFGVPVSDQDDREDLARYVARMRPGYQLLARLPATDVLRVKALVQARLHGDVLPASIVTDRAGRVLQVRPGLPSVSDLRRLLGAASGGRE